MLGGWSLFPDCVVLGLSDSNILRLAPGLGGSLAYAMGKAVEKKNEWLTAGGKGDQMFIGRYSKMVAVLAGWIVLSPILASAQKAIIIDDDLSANGDVLKVKIGVQAPGRMWRFKFGEFGVVSSKMGATKTTTTGAFLSPVEKSRAKQKFSFVLKGAGPETVSVKAAQNVESEALSEIGISAGISMSVVDISGTSDNLVAEIAFEGESVKPWTLLLRIASSLAVLKEKTLSSLLTDGIREIVITPVTSDEPGAKLSGTPARGYEFSEAGRALGAVQYWGGGLFGSNKNVVHMRRDLDTKTKLLLAAAMTTILQVKINAQASLD